MKAIFKRELQSYFTSMIGCVFVAFMVAITGVYFMVYNLNYGYPYFSYTLQGIVFVFLIAIPILTMRCFSEERKNKTDQLLLTSQVKLYEVVLGKFFSMAAVFLIPVLIYCFFPLIIKLQGEAHFLVDYSSILAFFLLGCVYISIGMFLSALTESQIIAAISTFGVLLILYLANGLTNFLPTTAVGNLIGLLLILTVIVLIIFRITKNWFLSVVLECAGVAAALITYLVKSSLFESLLSNWLGKLYLTAVLDNFSTNYLFDISGLVYYLSVIFVFVFLTIQTLQKRRWS